MKKSTKSFNETRRRVLKLFGLGVVSTGIFAIANSKKLFARQFLGDAPRVANPDMEYDPKLQIMVDPKTREPVFRTAAACGDGQEWTAVVTPGDDGPTGDGRCDDV